MGKAIPISAEDKRWRAEDDARALKRAQEIQSDPSRVKEAQKVIKSELSNLTKVASKILGDSPAVKRPATKKTTARKRK